MEVPCYMPKLLFELNEQRKRDFFCDCSILVEGRVFKAHRNVLFAGSGYFRALLVHYLQVRRFKIQHSFFFFCHINTIDWCLVLVNSPERQDNHMLIKYRHETH